MCAGSWNSSFQFVIIYLLGFDKENHGYIQSWCPRGFRVVAALIYQWPNFFRIGAFGKEQCIYFQLCILVKRFQPHGATVSKTCGLLYRKCFLRRWAFGPGIGFSNAKAANPMRRHTNSGSKYSRIFTNGIQRDQASPCWTSNGSGSSINPQLCIYCHVWLQFIDNKF